MCAAMAKPNEASKPLVTGIAEKLGIVDSRCVFTGVGEWKAAPVEPGIKAIQARLVPRWPLVGNRLAP
jgi:hypothetical protein